MGLTAYIVVVLTCLLLFWWEFLSLFFFFVISYVWLLQIQGHNRHHPLIPPWEGVDGKAPNMRKATMSNSFKQLK